MPHRYWRINWLTTRSSSFAAIAGVSLASVAGGATLTAPKTISGATASTSQGGHGASVAATATGSYWGSSGAAPQWWRADLGSAVEVSTVTIQVVALVDVYGPQAFTIDSSPDDISWTTRQSFTASSWTGNTEQAFHLTTPVSARYWRVSINSNFGGAGAVALSFVDFSGAWASSEQDTHPANWPIAALGYWGNNPAAGGTGWWAYDFGSAPPDIKEVKLTDLSLDSGFAPLTWTLDYSDDAVTWTTAKAFTSAAWSGGTNQTFNINASTWSTTDKSANLTLSGSNLIATAAANNVSARGKDPKRGGKYYVEHLSTTTQGGGSALGFATSRGSVGVATPAGSAQFQASASLVLMDAFGIQISGTGSIATWTTGSLVCCAIDLDSRLIWWRVGAAGNWNNSAANNPATGVGGLDLSRVGLGQGIDVYPYVYLAGSGNSVTSNFGGSAFSGTVPSGYTSGWDDTVAALSMVVPTQMGVEAWASTSPQVQVTQIGEEAFVIPRPDFQLTQAGSEVWLAGTPALQLTQAGLEMWATVQTTTVQMTLTQAGLEVWRTVADAPKGGPMISMIL